MTCKSGLIRPMRSLRSAVQSLLAIGILLAFFGCAAHMAMEQPEKKNLRVLEPGTSRAIVVAEFGPPHMTVEEYDGKLDQFQIKEGYTRQLKISRAVFHITADLFTYGLWEPFGILFEKWATGKDMTLQVHYDVHERVRTFELVSGEKTVLAKSRENATPTVAEPFLPWSVSTVLMPQPIPTYPKRLAVLLPQHGSTASLVSSGLDLTLAYLRTFHPSMTIVEREGLESVTHELFLQHTGKVHDDTTTRIGGWIGADTLLMVGIEQVATDRPQSLAERGGEVTHAVEIRMTQVETGLLLFRQTAVATIRVPAPTPDRAWPEEILDTAQRRSLRIAYTYVLAALAASFGDNPLGLVPDLTTRSSGIQLLGLLHGSPGHYAGLKQGDLILEANGKPYVSVTQRLALPVTLLVDIDGVKKDIRVFPSE